MRLAHGPDDDTPKGLAPVQRALADLKVSLGGRRSWWLASRLRLPPMTRAKMKLADPSNEPVREQPDLIRVQSLLLVRGG